MFDGCDVTEPPEHLADLWLESVARGTMHVFGEEMLKIPQLTSHGTKQLITDLGRYSHWLVLGCLGRWWSVRRWGSGEGTYVVGSVGKGHQFNLLVSIYKYFFRFLRVPDQRSGRPWPPDLGDADADRRAAACPAGRVFWAGRADATTIGSHHRQHARPRRVMTSCRTRRGTRWGLSHLAWPRDLRV